MGGVIGVGLILAVIVWIGSEKVLHSLSQTSPAYIALAIGVHVLSLALRYVKWWMMLRNAHDAIETGVLFLSSTTVGSLLPARMGELAPLVRKKYQTRQVSAAIVLNRVFETLATLVFGMIGLVLFGVDKRVIGAVGITLLLGVLGAYALFLEPRLPKRISRLTPRSEVLVKFKAYAVAFSRGIRENRANIPGISILSGVATVMDYLVIKIIFLGLGVEVNISLIAAAWLIATASSIVAITPAGLGISEILYLPLFDAANIPLSQVASMIIIGRVITFLIPPLLLLIVTVSRRRISQDLNHKKDLEKEDTLQVDGE